MPNTDTERIALKTENDRLLNAIYDLKTNLANKDEEIDDLQQTIQEINIKFAETESARVELRAAIEELAESSGKGEDREKRAWDRLAKVLGWTEAKSKDIKERLAKAIYKKKGFF
jgi:chromosome segregation ATPase